MKKKDLQKILNGEIEELKIDNVRSLRTSSNFVTGELIVSLQFNSNVIEYATRNVTSFTIYSRNENGVLQEIKDYTVKFYQKLSDDLNSTHFLVSEWK